MNLGSREPASVSAQSAACHGLSAHVAVNVAAKMMKVMSALTATFRMERAVARMERTPVERQFSSESVGKVRASGRCPAAVVLRFRAQAPLSRHATTPSCIAKAGDSRLAGWLTSSVQQ